MIKKTIKGRGVCIIYAPKNMGECHSPLHMQPKSLSSFISGYKSTTFKKNPLKWEMDKENPLNNPVGANGVHPLNYET